MDGSNSSDNISEDGSSYSESSQNSNGKCSQYTKGSFGPGAQPASPKKRQGAPTLQIDSKAI